MTEEDVRVLIGKVQDAISDEMDSTSYRNGRLTVNAPDGNVWTPNDLARAYIETSKDPHMTAIRLCVFFPEHGSWREVSGE